MVIDKIAIIGAGNGGQAAAADLSLRGFRVNLYDCDPEIIEGIQEQGGIKVKGELEGDAKLNKVTSDLEEALQETDLVMPIVPRFAHKQIAEECLPFLNEEHMLVLNPGSTGGALEFSRILKEGGKSIPVSSTSTLPYAARQENPGTVDIKLQVKTLFFATFPGRFTEKNAEEFKNIFPSVNPMKNVLEVSLNNGNPCTHVAPMVLNAGRIETNCKPFYFYREGITPSIARVIELLDEERLAICRALGFEEIPGTKRLFLTGYADEVYEKIYDSYMNSAAFADIKAPNSLNHRYLNEDVPYGLVTFSSLADMLEIPTPTMKTLIQMASMLNDRDYWKEGITVRDLGIAEFDKVEVKRFLMEGKL